MCVKATTLHSHHAIKINKTSYLPGAPFLEEERVGASSDGCSRPSRATVKSEHRSSKCSRLKKEEAAARSLLTFLPPSPTPQKHANLFSTSSCLGSDSAAGKRTHRREIQLPALSRSTCLTEARHAISRQKGRT